MAVQYANLVNKNGTIYNTQTGQGYSTPAALAADLGIQPTAIQWGSIQSRPDYQPGQSFGGSQAAPAPAPAPVQQPQQQPAQQPQQQTPAFTTGVPQLDEVHSQLQNYLQQTLAAGKTINPNIELTPATVQQFLDQAKGEINPYYASQIDSMKHELKSRQYDLSKQGQEQQFKQDLSSTRENLASNGAAYSGFRGQKEQALQGNAQRSIDSLTNSAAASAGSTLYNAAQTLGSRNIGDLGTGSFGTPTVSTAGAGGFGTSGTTSSYNPTNITGNLEYSQNADVRQLSDFLKNQEVAKRSRSFTGA